MFYFSNEGEIKSEISVFVMGILRAILTSIFHVPLNFLARHAPMASPVGVARHINYCCPPKRDLSCQSSVSGTIGIRKAHRGEIVLLIQPRRINRIKV